jgi:Ca2+-binding RTX toxin-like protein
MSNKSVLKVHVPSFSLSNPEITSKSEAKIVMIDDYDNRLTFEGSGLTFKNGALRSGVIDEMTIESHKGKVILSLTNIALDANTVPGIKPDALVEFSYTFGLRHDNLVLGSYGANSLNGMVGNDVVKGRGGNDLISGDTGNDVMIGGAGQDRFQFYGGDGRDRILDFDADNSDGKQDLIDADFSDAIGMKTVKGSAVLNFGHGDTLTLVGVQVTEIDVSDFVV